MISKKRFLTLIILTLFGILISGCAPKDISFETIAKQVRVVQDHDKSLQLQAITNVAASHIAGLAPDDEAKLQAIDYSKYWALMVVYGSGAGDGDNINNISQQGGVIYVRAELLPQSDGELLGSAY